MFDENFISYIIFIELVHKFFFRISIFILKLFFKPLEYSMTIITDEIRIRLNK